MSYTKKSLEELNVLDDFLMNAIVTTPKLGEMFCQTVLSVLLQKKIGKIKVVSQRIVPPFTPELRGIRMDVEILEYEGENTDSPVGVYDMEPNLRKNVHLPRHNRFYQAKLDARHLKSGEEYFEKLPELTYDDGLEFIYFYTGGHKGGNESIKAMLNYFQNSRKENVIDTVTEEVDGIVEQVRSLPEVRNEYMTLGDIIDYERKEAAEEATEQANKKTLINCICSYFRKLGEVPTELEKELENIENVDKLQLLYEKALETKNVADFIGQINN